MNNEQIDNTDYYRLPSGRQLEDFIAERGLKFAEGSALKYLWRAGKKDGESAEKDRAKAKHFILFTAKESNVAPSTVKVYLEHLIKMAQNDLASDGFLPQGRVCKIIEHYEHAVKKHPYFADKFYIDDIIDPDECLRVVRSELRYNSRIGNVDTLDVLKCEIMEIMSAQKHGEVEHAKEECYDAESPEEKMLGRINKVLEEYLFFINGTPGGKWPYYAKKYVARIRRIVNNPSAKTRMRRAR